MRTKEVNFGVISIKFIQMPSGVWVTPTKVIGNVLGYTKEGQKLSDHISGAWSDEFEKDDKIILDALYLAQIRKFLPDFDTSSANSMSFLTMKGVMKVIFKSKSEVAEKLRQELLAQIPDVVPQQNSQEETMSEKNDTKTIVAAPATKTAPKSAPKKSAPTVKKAAVRAAPKAKQLTLDVSPKGETALDMLMKTLEFGKKWNVFSKADIRATLDSVRETQLQKYKAESLRDVVNIGTVSGRVSYKDATQMVPVSNVQASSLTPNFDQIRGFFLTGHQKHPNFTDYLSAEEIGNLVNKTADQVRDPIKKFVNGLGHELPNVQIQKLIKERGGYFKGIATFLDKENLPVFSIFGVGMTTWFVMEDGKFVWRNYWSPSVVTGVLKALGFPTQSEINTLPEPTDYREHNPSTK